MLSPLTGQNTTSQICTDAVEFYRRKRYTSKFYMKAYIVKWRALHSCVCVGCKLL